MRCLKPFAFEVNKCPAVTGDVKCTRGNLGNVSGTSMASHAFAGCVLALEVVYVFVNIQMLELLDTEANITTLMSGASARIRTTESLFYA